ncbi:MAG: PIG-L family deacetylase [bacterium]|nr:PIG-L family deacetylase [bacterium]
MGKRRGWTWLFWLLWLAGGLYFADKSASYYKQVRIVPASVMESIPEMTPHHAGDRVVVFAPHPDDEVLGCAGVIQQAVQAGAQVWVVYMTNGDGFRLAVERQYRQSSPTPEQYIRFGELRQQEARRAMRLLGLADWRVIFLGYPDRGLYSLWQSHWTPRHSLRSYYTKTDTNPYRDSLRPGSLYCGQNVLRDVETVLRRTVPTHVYVTHSSDDHPDHAATALFVQTALARLRMQGIGFAQRVTLRHYLIHCGDWPQPQGLHEEEPLTPPAALLPLGLQWKQMPLTPLQQALKLEATQAHHSQMLMMSRFLRSFVRQNELFLESPVVQELAPRKQIAWDEPDQEDFLRELQAPGDFVFGRVRERDGLMELRLYTHAKPRTGFIYHCIVHVLTPEGKEGVFTLQAKAGRRSADAMTDESGVLFRLPPVPKGSLVTLHAQSRLAGLPVNKSFAQVVLVR